MITYYHVYLVHKFQLTTISSSIYCAATYFYEGLNEKPTDDISQSFFFAASSSVQLTICASEILFYFFKDMSPYEILYLFYALMRSVQLRKGDRKLKIVSVLQLSYYLT